VSGAVRRATPDDDRIVARIHVAGWRETYPGIVPASVLARLDANGRRGYWRSVITDRRSPADVFLARFDGADVGFGVCGREQVGLEGYQGEFHALYLLRAAQGRGIGTALMAAMASSLIERGMTAVTVWVLRDNWRARRFYEKLGGRMIAERPLDFDGTCVMEVAYGWADVTPISRLPEPAAGLPRGRGPSRRGEA
jgi:ribosomal protein S18 acetylase RimI-like enzyme